MSDFEDILIKSLALLISVFAVILSWIMRGYPQTNIEQMLNGIQLFLGYLVIKDFLIIPLKISKWDIKRKGVKHEQK